MAEWQRTHTCGELRKEHIGQTVILNGWVHVTRVYNDQVFIDLRDRYGLTQVVVELENAATFETAKQLGREFVITATGEVAPRAEGKINEKLQTGEIEVKASSLAVLNTCPTPKFPVTEFPDDELAHEDIRLEYRYLDLRRQSAQRTLLLRHQMNTVIRNYFNKRDFVEVETPFLGKSTPEGARDYLVPSRLFHGQFYALPQSPQLYKQVLMVAGFDRYYQLAHCMRDEDLRADRQPEFTQLDLEMSFVEVDDILTLLEGMTVEVFRECIGVELPTPFPRMSHCEAMLRYGTDKPDLRFGMEIVDLTDLAPETEFRVFRETAASGGRVRGIRVPGGASRFSNTELNKGSLVEFVRGVGAKGLAWLKVEGSRLTSSIEKFFPAGVQETLRQRFGAEDGDLLMFVADNEHIVCTALGGLRVHLAERMDLISPTNKDFQVLWVVDFPSFSWDEEEKRWVANHHPFTSPCDEDLELLESDPGRVRAKAYDLVINGYEIGGGSIRIHNQEVQSRVFRVLGIDEKSAEEKFGFLLNALRHGAPPHGGIALGLDRCAMLLAGTSNIRDVIAFPKNQKARDLMTGAPAEVERRQLKELGLI